MGSLEDRQRISGKHCLMNLSQKFRCGFHKQLGDFLEEILISSQTMQGHGQIDDAEVL